jgi:hypothetical protein
MKMPAVTIVAAWISAEIGVGPSIESGSHTCRGTCALLPIAPMKRQMQMTDNTDQGRVAPDVDRRPRDLRRRREDRRVVERPEMREDEADPEHEAEVADAVARNAFRFA